MRRPRELKPIHLIISLTLLIVTSPVLTQDAKAAEQKAPTERVFEQRSTTGRSTYITVRGENELWVVEAFAKNTDGWQDRVWRKTFRTLNEVEANLKPLHLTERPIALLEQAPEIRSPLASGSLWKVTEGWNQQWEERYADWVNQNADPQFFVKYQIATDCADVAYSLRWIFARIHGLPVGSKLAGSGELMTQDSVRSDWLRSPTAANWWEDKRFLKAINYLMDNTYTHTLVREGYPIEISKRALTAGTFFLRLFGKTGHTQFVHRTFYQDPSALPLKLMASTVPRSVRSLFETDFWEFAPPTEGEGGFMRFRWAVKSSRGTMLIPATQMPFYSLAQFKSEFMGNEKYFAMAVLGALNPGFSLEKWLQAGLTDIKTQLVARKDIVENGAQICARNSCAPGTAEYEDWSTPSRDKRLGQLFTQLESVSRRSDLSDTLGQLWDKALNEPALELNGVAHPLKVFTFIWNDQMYSSEPAVAIARRWGIEPVGFIDNLVERMTTSLNSREKKISSQGSACTTSACPNEGNEWLKWQTFAEDRDLVRLRYVDRAYCENLPDHCSQYRTLRQNQMISFGQTPERLTAWLDRAVWLNSDPNQSREIRWGSLRDRFRSIVIPEGQTILISKAGWKLQKSERSSTTTVIEHVVTGAALPAPNGFVWSDLAPTGEWAVANSSHSDEILVRHLSTGSETRFPFHMDPGVAAPIFMKDLLIVQDQTRSIARIVKLVNTPTVLAELVDVTNIMHVGMDGVILVTSASRAGALYDLRSGVQRIELPSETAAFASLNVYIQAENDRYLIMNACSEWASCLTYSLEKKSGTWKLRPEFKGLVTLAGPNHMIRNDFDSPQGLITAKLERIDENLNIISSRTIGSYADYREPYACAWIMGGTTSTCYAVSPSRFDENPVFTDRVLNSWDKDFIVWSRPGQNVNHLASVANPNRALYTSKSIRSAHSTENGWFIARNGDGNQYQMLIDAMKPTSGSLITYESNEGRFNGAHVNGSGGGPSFQRGVTIGLPSNETLWLERK